MDQHDRHVLRELALQLAQIAAHPIQEMRRCEWVRHNEMEQVAPRVLIYPDLDGAWKEMIPDRELQISDPFLRDCEYQLRRKLFHWEQFHDDFVFEPSIRIECAGEYTGYHYAKEDQDSAWGLKITGQKPDPNGGAYAFKPALINERDLEILLHHQLNFIYDQEDTKKRVELLQDILGDILRVELEIPYVVLVASLLIEFVHLRGLTQMMMDLYDQPAFFHQVMNHMANSKVGLLKKLERENRLMLNNRDHFTGSGGLGYTSQLPQSDSLGAGIGVKDLWGFADAQEFSDVSCEMFKEFVLPYQTRVLKEFGLVCYGCCEKMDKKVDVILEIPNIRRVSVSPWTDIRLAAEKIGRKCLYSRKPNPTMVSMGIYEDVVRRDILEVLEAAGNGNVEFILKDIRTCSHDPRNLSRWVDIAQSLCK